MSEKTIIEVAGEPTKCRTCGNHLDAATPTEEGTLPQPGDISVCFYCLTWSIYGDDLSLRPPRNRAERKRIERARRALEEGSRG